MLSSFLTSIQQGVTIDEEFEIANTKVAFNQHSLVLTSHSGRSKEAPQAPELKKLRDSALRTG